MIEQLKIKNVALARNVNLEFTQGFNVLLGETGAGKSIILDALNFVLGAKADKMLITSGQEDMRVEASFDSYSKQASQVLEEMGIEDEDLLIITRTLNLDGKSKIKINGSNATLKMLRELSKYLVDSYSQHENLLLLKAKNHLGILDTFNPNSLYKDKEELSQVLNQINITNKALKEIGGSGENRERMIELLQFQVAEIEDLKPTQKEENEIVEQLEKYNNAEKIVTALNEATRALDLNEYSAISNIRSAIRNLNSIEKYGLEYEELNKRLNSCLYELEDINASLASLQGDVTFNEKEYELLDEKLDRYKAVKKKYGATVQNVLAYLEKTKLELDNLVNAEERLEELQKTKHKQTFKAMQICKNLSDKRKAIASEVQTKIEKELFELGMKNARFIVDFKQKENVDASGFDGVEFLFSANKGMELKPLSKIISGGEMSRFSLAVKNIISEEKACLVFDEIDSGISGEIGKAVGEKIAKLANGNQVICISHSPQVCAMADSFYHVTKGVQGGATSSSVEKISDSQVVMQLAKMSAGKTLTDIAISHAKELVSRAEEFKKSL